MATIDPGYRYALVKYAGNGSQTDWQIAFDGGYLSQDDVYAYSYLTADRSDRQAHTLTFISEAPSESTVRITPAVATDRTLIIARLTQRGEALVDFINRSMLTEKNLNTITQQAIYSVAELQDAFEELTDQTNGDIASMSLTVIEALNTANAADAKADTAIASADSANATAATAVNIANAASAKGDLAIQKANDTQAAADAATAAASSATDAATAATTLVQNIQGQVDAAVDTANAASEQANNAATIAQGLGGQIDAANATANDALNVANAIDAKAQSALDQSTQAVDAAGQAQSDAAAAVAAVANKPDASTLVLRDGTNAMTGNLTMANGTGMKSSGTAKVAMEADGNSWFVQRGLSTAPFFSLKDTNGTVLWNWDSGGHLTTTKNITSGKNSITGGIYLMGIAGGDAISLGADRLGLTNMYGFGSEANTLYSKAPIAHRWYIGVNSDGGASASMDLQTAGLTLTSGWVRATNFSPTGGQITSRYANLNLSFDTGFSGTIYMRPSGYGSSAGQFTLVPSGNAQFSGQVAATGGFQPGSSIKLKTALRKNHYGLAAVLKLRTMVGQYKRWFNPDGKRRLFVIAEDIAEYIPEAHAPGAYTIEDGKHAGSYDGYSLEQMVPVLVKAIQELHAEVAMLKEKINE